MSEQMILDPGSPAAAYSGAAGSASSGRAGAFAGAENGVFHGPCDAFAPTAGRAAYSSPAEAALPFRNVPANAVPGVLPDVLAAALPDALAAAPTGGPAGAPAGNSLDALAGGQPGSPAATPAHPDPAWLETLPEELRDLAGQAGNAQSLRSALERGLTHQPVRSADEVEVSAPAGLELNQEAVQWFKDLAVQQGFSKNQISALVQAYNKQLVEGPDQQSEAARQELREFYGPRYQAKISAAVGAVNRLDCISGGSLRPLLRLGLGNHPEFVKVMAVIGEVISDSAMPGQPMGGSGAAAMSAEAFMKEIFNSRSQA